MAKILTDSEGVTHLRGEPIGALCGAVIPENSTSTDGTLTCPECAKIALTAIELSTKAERRLWREL
jgi:hypothetical protein